LARFIISTVYYIVTGNPGGVPDLNNTKTTFHWLLSNFI
jgi:hypothetical protein